MCVCVYWYVEHGKKQKKKKTLFTYVEKIPDYYCENNANKTCIYIGN